MDIPLKCLCGAVRGVVKDLPGSHASRMVCFCDDCQAFAHQLGRAADVLDANGGTDILPVVPAAIKITKGAENLRALRLTEKGLLRWYAGCCNTPVANTPSSPRLPYVGTIHTIMDHGGHGRTREQDLGPVAFRIMARFGRGQLPVDAHPKMPLKGVASMARFVIAALLRRQQSPSPFFGPDGKPRVEPQILTGAEREALSKLCGT